VVVDDGSSDGFEEAIAPYETRVTVIRQQRRGVAAARNAALMASDSEVVAYLDADDRWDPTKIEVQLRCLAASPRMGLVHTGVTFIDESGQPLPLARPEPPSGESVGMAALIEDNRVCMSSVLHKREAFDTEYFAPGLRTCEDWDLWLRIARRGFSSGYISEPLTHYRMHPSNTSRKPELMLEGTIAVMGRVLARERRKSIKQAVVRRRARAFCDLGNLAYARRDLPAARRLYTEGLRGARLGDLRRMAVSFVPPLYDLISWIRSAN
jgi:glycosyltransferase involved in cell wall biosynthesis